MADDGDDFLPLEFVTKHMEEALPEAAKLSISAVETVRSCASIFIAFLTGQASHNGDSIDADDVISSMGDLGFDDYVEPLSIYLERFRRTNVYRKLVGSRRAVKIENGGVGGKREERERGGGEDDGEMVGGEGGEG
ncbi:nuclear transcription factor Y subunit B-3-like [Wolffia australiana]